MAITYTQFEKIAAATGLGSVAAQDLKDAYDALIEIDGGTGDLVVASLEVNGPVVIDTGTDPTGFGARSGVVAGIGSGMYSGVYEGGAYSGVWIESAPADGPELALNHDTVTGDTAILSGRTSACAITIGQATAVDTVAIKGATTVTGSLAVTGEPYILRTAASGVNAGAYAGGDATSGYSGIFAESAPGVGPLVDASSFPAGDTITVKGQTTVCAIAIGVAADKLGFHGTAPIVKQTGVAVTAEAIHAALVALGLIAA